MIEKQSFNFSADSEKTLTALLEHFGWEVLTRNTNGKNKSQPIEVLFVRDTSRPNYARLSQLEDRYFALLNKRPKPLNKGIAFFLLIFFLLPGIVYIVYKKSQMKKWKKQFEVEGRKILEEAGRLL